MDAVVQFCRRSRVMLISRGLAVVRRVSVLRRWMDTGPGTEVHAGGTIRERGTA